MENVKKQWLISTFKSQTDSTLTLEVVMSNKIQPQKGFSTLAVILFQIFDV